MTAQQTVLSREGSVKMAAVTWLQRFQQLQSYRHKAAEWSMIILFISGLLLWDAIPVIWPLFRSNLFIHVVVGLFVFPFTTGLFWWAHRQLLLKSKTLPAYNRHSIRLFVSAVFFIRLDHLLLGCYR